MAIAERSRVPSAAPARSLAPEATARTTRPVKFWALVGGLIWCLQIYILMKWVTGPFFHQVQPGPLRVPSAMKIAIVTYLVIQWGLFFALGYRWVIRPLLREGNFGIDGVLFLAWAGFFWMWDPMG